MRNNLITIAVMSTLMIACTKSNNATATEKSQTDQAKAQTNKPANTDDCFKLALNKTYTKTDRDDTQVQHSEVTFENQKAIAITTETDGIKADTIFDQSGRTQLASQTYGIAALGTDPNTVVSTLHYQAPLPTFPSNLKAGQTFKMTYNSVLTSPNDDERTPSKLIFDVTFVGFENLKFTDTENKALEFKNACHFVSKLAKESPDTPMIDGQTDEWFAEGYGIVKSVQKTKDGEIFSSDSIGDEAQP